MILEPTLSNAESKGFRSLMPARIAAWILGYFKLCVVLLQERLTFFILQLFLAISSDILPSENT